MPSVIYFCNNIDVIFRQALNNTSVRSRSISFRCLHCGRHDNYTKCHFSSKLSTARPGAVKESILQQTRCLHYGRHDILTFFRNMGQLLYYYLYFYKKQDVLPTHIVIFRQALNNTSERSEVSFFLRVREAEQQLLYSGIAACHFIKSPPPGHHTQNTLLAAGTSQSLRAGLCGASYV